MPITSIGNDSGPIAADLLQRLGNELGKQLQGKVPSGTQPPNVEPENTPAAPAGQPMTSVLPAALNGDLNSRLAALPPLSDVAALVISEVATADLTKLIKILDPTADPVSHRILDTLMVRAVQEVASGNVERAVGYLADFATRDPRRAEVLSLEPQLAPVRDKIDSMVTRMTIVAKMSAEDALSRAEQTASRSAGKVADWETHSNVLVKLAQRFFDAGGYANYSHSSELARIVNVVVSEARPVAHALAAAAAASCAYPGQMLPGVNVPYWASPDVPSNAGPKDASFVTKRSYLATSIDDLVQNFRDVKAISTGALKQLWQRAPLLVLLLIWFSIGIAGGVAIFITSRIWPDSAMVALGNFAFNLWGIGCIALVGFGFYMRVRSRP